MAGLGQHVPPAVGQQCPHVPCLLHSGGQSPPTECLLWEMGEVRGKVRRGKGGGKGDG